MPGRATSIRRWLWTATSSHRGSRRTYQRSATRSCTPSKSQADTGETRVSPRGRKLIWCLTPGPCLVMLSGRFLTVIAPTERSHALSEVGMTVEKLILAKPRGFCAGVDRAIDVVKIALDLYDKQVYVRKEIVHNRHVVDELRQK